MINNQEISQRHIKAADDLAQRLREAGMTVKVERLDYDFGVIVSVHVWAPIDSVLAWLDHLAVPVTPLSHSCRLHIHAYNAVASGCSLALVIVDTTDLCAKEAA